MANYSIRPVPICKQTMDKGFMTWRMNYGQQIDAGNYLFYIEGPKLNIIVDTGASAEMFTARGYGGATDVQTVEEGLGKLNLKPEDIDIVIITHLHWDHAAFVHKFTKAKVIIQKTELDFARNPHPANASAYDEKFIKDINIEVVDGDEEIVAGVKVLLTPGHTPGNQSVVVETAKGLAIICGFCSTSDNFELPPELRARGVQILPPGLHVNLFQAYDSTLRIKQEADIILPLHDAKFLDEHRIP